MRCHWSSLRNWPTQLAFYPARDQCQLTPGAWVCKLKLSLKITTLFRFVTTEATGNLSVNRTRGHSVHKWLLVFPQWGSVEMTLCRRSPLDGFLLCGSVNLSPVLTLVFLHQPAGSNLGHPSFIWTSQEGYTLPFRKRPVLQAGFWFSILNDSDGISGTTWTSLQPEEWLTSRLHTPSPLSTNKEMPAPTKPVSNIHNL